MRQEQRADLEPPAIRAQRAAGGFSTVSLTGHWTLRGIAHRSDRLIHELHAYTANPEIHWDLRTMTALDSVGAFVLWRASQGRRPQHLEVRPEHLPLLRRWTERQIPQEPAYASGHIDPLAYAARIGRCAIGHGMDFISLVGQFFLDCGLLLRDPAVIPWRDISANIFHAGVQALGIVALVGLLTGVVVSYLSSLELRSYGAGNFIVIISGIGILRELAPILTAVLVAGRSGSAMAAQLGVMRVTQEMDALSAMGVSQSMRLVLPRIVAMVLVMPLLIVWSDMLAIVGSMCAARVTLGMRFVQYLSVFPDAVPLSNFWLGVGKGAVFGVLIALVACHCGLRIRPNTESLGRETTNAVVTAITLAILVDAAFAIAFKSVGLP